MPKYLSYQSDSISSALKRIQNGTEDVRSNNTVIFTQLLSQRERMNVTIHNITQHQLTAQILQQTVHTGIH